VNAPRITQQDCSKFRFVRCTFFFDKVTMLHHVVMKVRVRKAETLKRREEQGRNILRRTYEKLMKKSDVRKT